METVLPFLEAAPTYKEAVWRRKALYLGGAEGGDEMLVDHARVAGTNSMPPLSTARASQY
eukprot:1709151-Rhodomonas_salina.1